MKKLSSADFDQAVLSNSKLSVVDFNATWCGPCKKLTPILADLSKENEGKADFFEVDAGDQPDLAQKYGVMSLPTIVMFKNGNIVERIVGLIAKDKLSEKIKAKI